MLVSRLLRSLLKFLSPGIVPDEGGGAAPAPAPAPAEPTEVDNTLPPVIETPAPTPAPAPAEPEADPFAALTTALDKVGTPEVPPAPTPAPTAAPAAGPAPTPAPAPADVDLTPPEGMSDRAQQRWQQLTERAKLVPDLERRATEATTQLQSVRTMVNESGLSADEFTEMLQMASLFKRGDAKALEQLDGLRADLATRLGVEVAGVDPLAAHPDLKADVESMALTKERALEIVKHRNATKRADERAAGQNDLQQHRELIHSAAEQMNATLKAKAGTPGHEAKLKYIQAQFANPETLRTFVTTYQPQQWQAALLMMYDAFTPPVVAAPPPGPQPLRPGGRAAGAPVRVGPVTSESAVQGAFDKLGL